jgi:ribonuclease R
VPRRLNSHRLIEAFMLLANEAVAQRLTARKIPTLYRVHDRPDAVRLAAYARLASAFGRRFPRVDRITPHGIQAFLSDLQDEPAQRVLSAQLLRSMKKAVYARDNIGHFGLACPCYTHFTSPIRRYPDLLVHRLLRESEFKRMTAARREQLEERLPAIAETATQREITAQEAEWGALEVKQIRYLEERVGDHFQATVVSVVTAGLFCELDDVLIDGFVRVSSLTDDYYTHDENRGALVGERTGRSFRLGDRVTVALTAASRHRRQVDLRVVEGGQTARPKGASQKRSAKPRRAPRPDRKRRTPTRR